MLGIVFAVFASALTLSILSTDGVQGALLLEVASILNTVIAVACGVTGIKGANTPSRIAPFVTWCAIGIAFQIGCAILDYVLYGSQTNVASMVSSTAIGLVLYTIGFAMGRKVREQSEK